MPVTGNSIQKLHTLDDIVNRVLSRKEIKSSVEENLKPKIVNECNVQQKNIYTKLLAEDENAKAQYLQGATFLFTSGEVTFETIETTNPLINEVQRLEATEPSGRIYGTVPYIDPVAFKNAGAFVYFDNSILYTMEGRRVKIFTGQNFNSSGFTYKLWYIRMVNTLSSPTDYMDLPSDKIDELVNNIIMAIQPKQEAVASDK